MSQSSQQQQQQQQQSSSSSGRSSTSRFSLTLLEPGEICFEDYLVYYSEFENPFDAIGKDKSAIDERNYQKGSLKICLKSVVFDPFNLSYPLLRFPLKQVEKLVLFNEESVEQEVQLSSSYDVVGEDDDIYGAAYKSSPKPSPATVVSRNVNSPEYKQLKVKCFAIKAKQVVQCKVNNKIGPYKVVKRENADELHYFQFIFTNVDDSLSLLGQLLRASTLNFEAEDIMLQKILKGSLQRNFTFDRNKMDDMYREQIQFECEVNKISPLVNNPGYLILTNMCLYYEPFRTHENEQQIIKIKLGTIRYVIKRRYHLKGVGCEIVFDRKLESASSSSAESSASASASSSKLPYLYLTFEDERTRDQFHMNLVVLQRDKLVNLNEFSQENMLQKWRYGAISNFDYLMYLNNMADRSYNDLTQYPVFPWVLADYTSETLDLNDPAVFRDLSKPVGALNEERLGRLKQRYTEMQATTTSFSQNAADKGPQPMFLYGSHYSTPAFVLFYLVRQYPEWQLCLQNGRFDHPNRLFHSIADTWRNCLTIDSDVKELIPEFYDTNTETSDHSSDDDYRLTGSSSGDHKLGSFLRNGLELDLGVRSDGTRVNHVILPKWAGNSPGEFIRKMRDALESPCVSEQLHKWIDLIFGYKQRGPEAIKSDNLFYYLCYEGAVDLDSIENYSERKSLEIQIQEFGQIPTQLFKQPHLARVKADLVNDLKTLSLIEYEREQQHLDDQFADDLLDLLVNKSHEGRPTYPPTLPAAPKKKGSISGQSDKSAGSAASGFTHSPHRINASNLSQLTVKLEIKLHKGAINDCLFIDPPPTQAQATSHQNTPTAPNALNENLITLPLVCSVSSDNWMKIYSLEDRSIFRSHNVCDFSLSSVDCVQVASSEVVSPLFSDSEESAADQQGGDEEDDYEHIEIDQLDKQAAAKKVTASKVTRNRFNSTAGQTQYSRTLLFLSCWDNSIYVYDMNYNRCIHSLNSSHDDAVTRIRTKLIKRRINPKRTTRAGSSGAAPRSSNYSVAFYLITASWDSLIKLWRLPTSNVKYQATSNRRLSVGSPATTPTGHSMSNRLSGMSDYFRSSSHHASHHVQHPSLNLLNSDSIRLQFSNELCHDSAIYDFQLSKSYLASLCKDGSLYLWKLIRSKSHTPAHITTGAGQGLSALAAENQDGQLELTEDDFDEVDPDGDESESGFGEESATADSSSSADHQSDKKEDYSYQFVYSIQSCEEDIGKITDCKLIEAAAASSGNEYGAASSRQDQVHTLAICTSLGFVKIYNLRTKCELFSLRIQVPQTQTNAKLTKLHYTNDLIITIDSSGHIYFIDLKQQQQLAKPAGASVSSTQQPTLSTPTLSLSSSFLSHTIKLTSNSLTCLSLYNEIIISVGDSAGNLYLLSLFDF